MKRSNPRLAVSAALIILLAGPFAPGTTLAAGAAGSVEAGKAIAFDRAKGNCLACHRIEGGESPGNIAPPLMAMKARYPNRSVLRAQIFDPTARNPLTSMPPFGKHRILSEVELEQVVDFIWSL